VATHARTGTRRQAILDAALMLFTKRGVHGTSVEDICAASGASNGSVYHHFGSKEGIASELYANAIADYQRGALAAITSATSAERGFRSCVEHYLRWVAENRELAVLMLAVEHSQIRALGAERVASLNDAFRAGIGVWMRERAVAGDLPDVPADLLLPALLGPARRFAELWLEGRTRTSPTDAAQVLADLVWCGLAGRSPQGAADPGPRRRRGG
jgi:AcrR family transcriptional regulator